MITATQETAHPALHILKLITRIAAAAATSAATSAAASSTSAPSSAAIAARRPFRWIIGNGVRHRGEEGITGCNKLLRVLCYGSKNGSCKLAVNKVRVQQLQGQRVNRVQVAGNQRGHGRNVLVPSITLSQLVTQGRSDQW